ncbi:uncharacterized protein GGS25DRAFT_498593 [Hypoxylon fragiforme]|uniref:uncharacterized protein n=1 Tax=Hypoxylon fragiforme TaxID=63214 RepID=UPI0020C5F347|nr:uncharacterized protein GGS25DRAFT_498593 [Hypoxylon fragiforme]KAI2605914.1 hypothetical protein GGS25DRAFT_498593 [Hypoxylon fragiforme]
MAAGNPPPSRPPTPPVIDTRTVMPSPVHNSPISPFPSYNPPYSTDNGQGTLAGFSVADPGFDPANKGSIGAHYVGTGGTGIHDDPHGIEEDIESEIAKAIADFEAAKGSAASDEERDRITTTIRSLRESGWLEGAKTQLEGKDSVPIAWFNRVVAENERYITHIAQKMEAQAGERADWVKQLDVATANDEERNRQMTHLEDQVSQIQVNNDILQAELDLLRTEKAQLEDDKKELQTHLDDCTSHRTRLDSEISVAHQQRRDLQDRFDDLTQQLKDSRGRETALKDQQRTQDQAVSDLQKQVDDLNKKLADHNAQLQGTVSSSRTPAAGGGGTKPKPSPKSSPERKPRKPKAFDIKKLMQEIRDAKAANRDVADWLDAVFARYMGDVADANHLRDFWAAVEAMRRDCGGLQAKIVSLYHKLGFPDDPARPLTGEQALDEMIAHVDKQPGDDLRLQVYALKLAGDTQTERMRTRTELVRVNTLEMQLDLAKTTDTLERETRMRYGVHNDAEVDRRVDARTQMFRDQRRAILDRVFGASHELHRIAQRTTTTPQSRADIEAVRTKYLNAMSLPMPKP